MNKKQNIWQPLLGKKIAAFGLTEPNAGTDAADSTSNKLFKIIDYYIMNGTKILSRTLGLINIIFAMTDKIKKSWYFCFHR